MHCICLLLHFVVVLYRDNLMFSKGLMMMPSIQIPLGKLLSLHLGASNGNVSGSMPSCIHIYNLNLIKDCTKEL